MALPELLMPGGLPDFKADSYTFTPDPLYAPVERHTGEARTRRLFLSVPGTVDASLEVSQAQLEELSAWYEGPLEGGALPFTAKLANIGSGFRWCKAFCLPYTTEHREGTSHLLNLRLRLVGTAELVEPVPGTLASEAVCALYWEPVVESLTASLRSESVASLVITVLDGQLLSAECLCRLVTTFDGVPAGYTWLYSEVTIPLQGVWAVEPSAALDSEVLVSLLVSAETVESLTSEASISLSVTVEAVLGYVASPSAFLVEGYSEYPSKAAARATVELASDGTIRTRVNTLAYEVHANWWAPTLAGKGVGHWGRLTVVAGDSSEITGAAIGAWLDLTTSRAWTLTAGATVSEIFGADVLLEVASDPDGITIVSTCSGTLGAEYVGL